HAFSQADKQFLLQLGRVKDAFDLDKMFFLVNAADLADSKEELNEVLEYVEKQLLAHGIRQPRLFALSSRMALEARQQQDEEAVARSGMAAFEREFAKFAERELAAAAVHAAQAEIHRADHRLGQVIASLQAGDDERNEQLARQRIAGERLT